MKNQIRNFSLLVLLLLCGCLCGCITEKYELELTPKDGKLERHLTYSNNGGTNSVDSEVERLKKHYDSKFEKIGNSATFKKTFGERMPDDVGGHGSYKRWESPMGKVELYVERFRGSHDYNSQLNLRREAVDDLTDLLVDYLTVEMGHQPGFDKVEEFLEKKYRNELHNLSICIWQTGFETDAKRQESWFRVGQFLLEREYIQLDQIPAAVRSFQEGDFPPILLESIRKRLVSQFPDQKIGQEATECFATLNKITTSFNKYVDGADLVAGVLLPKWKEKLKGQEGQFSKRKLAGGLASAAFFPPSLPLFSPAALAVSLQSQREPLLSNGRWDSHSGAVKWRQSIGGRDPTGVGLNGIPGFAFSVMAISDLKYQTAHFGREVLSDDDLVTYVLWYNGLTKNEKARMDKLIGGFDSSTRHVLELAKFRNRVGSDFEGGGVGQLINVLKEKEGQKNER